VKGSVRRLAKGSAAVYDRLRTPEPGVVVLLYHRVGARAALEMDLPRGLFDDQMATLAAEARVVALDDALGRLEEPEPAAGLAAPVVVTFDDGTADFVDVALPVLVRHRVPVILYLATAFVEEARPFPHGGAPLSWSALADAVDTGLVTVGSHTHSHALLDRLPPERAATELDRSIGLIRDRLGVDPAHFAYPKALAGSAPVAAEVARRFRSAALAGTRANPYGRTDRMRLARSPIQASDGMRWFRHKLNGGMGLEDTMRQLRNRRHYAGAST
jgi:peptidoglycan/xylan/chitin deacetylase (PgdA/CDA1 family)